MIAFIHLVILEPHLFHGFMFFTKQNLIPTALLIIQNDIYVEKLHLYLLLAALHQIINNKLTADVYAINTFLGKTRREK